jgi:hypothetical protein
MISVPVTLQTPSCWRPSSPIGSTLSSAGRVACPTGPSATFGAISAGEHLGLPSTYSPANVVCSNAVACCFSTARPRIARMTKSHAPLRCGHRTVGDTSRTGAVRSSAASVDQVIEEIVTTRITERGETRADDRMAETAMEDRKRFGYF